MNTTNNLGWFQVLWKGKQMPHWWLQPNSWDEFIWSYHLFYSSNIFFYRQLNIPMNQIWWNSSPQSYKKNKESFHFLVYQLHQNLYLQLVILELLIYTVTTESGTIIVTSVWRKSDSNQLLERFIIICDFFVPDGRYFKWCVEFNSYKDLNVKFSIFVWCLRKKEIQHPFHFLNQISSEDNEDFPFHLKLKVYHTYLPKKEIPDIPNFK